MGAKTVTLSALGRAVTPSAAASRSWYPKLAPRHVTGISDGIPACRSLVRIVTRRWLAFSFPPFFGGLRTSSDVGKVIGDVPPPPATLTDALGLSMHRAKSVKSTAASESLVT